MSLWDFKIIEDYCESLPSGATHLSYDLVPGGSSNSTRKGTIQMVQGWLDLNKNKVGFLHEQIQRHLDNCFATKKCTNENKLKLLNGTLQYSMEYCDYAIQASQTIINSQRNNNE